MDCARAANDPVTVSGILSFSWHRSEIAVSRSVTCFWWIKSSRIAQRHPDDLLVARGIERDACFVIAAPRQCDPMSERVLSADHLFSREIIWLIGWSKRQGADA